MGAVAMERAGSALDVARSDWRERHVVKRLPMACWADSGGGLAGGEAKSAVCGRGAAESQGNGDGNNMTG